MQYGGLLLCFWHSTSGLSVCDLLLALSDTLSLVSSGRRGVFHTGLLSLIAALESALALKLRPLLTTKNHETPAFEAVI